MDSSFVDVTRNDSNNDATSKGSRLSQEDEWLDIDVVTSSTSNEERLRNQVKALQRALDEKNLELMESSVQVDVLKGHKILLENARSDLQEELSGQAKQIAMLQEALSSSNAQVMELKEKLLASESLVQSTKTELQSYQVKTAELELEMKYLHDIHQEESRSVASKLHDSTKLTDELKVRLVAKEECIMARDACMTKFQEDMKLSQKQQATLQTTIVAFQQEKDELQRQVLRLTGDARTLAVFAENLRVAKQTLERKLQNSQDKMQQKEEENKQWQRHHKQQQEEEIKNLAAHLSSITHELEYSKDAVTQLAGELMAARAEAEHTNETLEELKQKHEQYVAEQKHRQDEYVEREELLRLEVEQIKSANELRLEELRQILGLRFRDLVVRSKGRSGGNPPPAAKMAPKNVQNSGRYIPPVPILRTVMGLV